MSLTRRHWGSDSSGVLASPVPSLETPGGQGEEGHGVTVVGSDLLCLLGELIILLLFHPLPCFAKAASGPLIPELVRVRFCPV